EAGHLHNAKDLVTYGEREWKRNNMVKALRNTAAVPVLGIVQGDSHTFDFWVQYKDPNNGKISAIRPTMVAWIDTRSRLVMGTVWAKVINAQVVKQSVVKFIYEIGAPKCILIDNGKDYTANEMLGRKRNERNSLLKLDQEAQGFYKSMGILDDYRTLPYQPWAKGPIERFFGTVCLKFSKWFGSYVGTLTGSKTSSKIKKDVDKLLEQGKLLTMEEAYQIWLYWLDKEYHHKTHSGLKRMHERWTKPMELFENAENRIQLPPPPVELAEMLLMKCKMARVLPIGIKHNSQIYMNYTLTEYIHDKVFIRWNPEDMSKIYVYDLKNRKICEAECKELLEYNGAITEKNLLDHLKEQRKQLAADKSKIASATTPYGLRGYEGDPLVTGKLQLMIEAKKKDIVEGMEDEIKLEEKKSISEYFESKAKADLKKLQKLQRED
ncbi:MAG: transposase, partial [Anaerovorax sp.]